MTDTPEVKLHVGYVGRTRDGKRVEIIYHENPDSMSAYYVGDNDFPYWKNGTSDKTKEMKTDIIGPWVGEPADINGGIWIAHNGGPMPEGLHGKSEIARAIPGGSVFVEPASALTWEHFHGFFRVTKPYVEPKRFECWMNVYLDGDLGCVYLSKAEADDCASDDRIRCVHMIEAEDQ